MRAQKSFCMGDILGGGYYRGDLVHVLRKYHLKISSDQHLHLERLGYGICLRFLKLFGKASQLLRPEHVPSTFQGKCPGTRSASKPGTLSFTKF